MHQRKASFKWRAAAAVLAMLVLAGVGVSVGGGTSFFRLGTIVSRFTGKAAKVVYRIQGIPVTQQEIQAGVALRVENGETVKTAKKEVIKDIITKKTLYVLAKKNGCTVSDQEYDDYAKLLKTQMNKAENRKEIRDFYAGFGGESAYWKNMEPVIRQNLAVRKYIDSQTGTQTEEEIKQEAYESGAKQTDLDAFEQVVEDVCEEIGDYLKTLQKSDASVYYFASSDKERVTKSIDKEEICAIGNHTIVTREQVQMYTKFYEITYDKTLSEKKAIAYAKERNALYRIEKNRTTHFESKYARLQREEHFSLKPTTDYLNVDTTLTIQAPQAGIYFLKAVPDGKKGVSDGTLMNVTALKTIYRPLPDGTLELVVVDAVSGQPVSEAEVTIYTEKGGGYSPQQTYQADKQGTLKLDFLNSNKYWYNAHTAADNAMPISNT